MGFKLIIAGSRTFKDYELLKKSVSSILEHTADEIEIVSGTAKGADKLGEKYAQENNYAVKKCPAEWSKYGMSAGYKRNKEMAEYADQCICFWDGESKGTEMMIELAQKSRLPTKVILFKK